MRKPVYIIRRKGEAVSSPIGLRGDSRAVVFDGENGYFYTEPDHVTLYSDLLETNTSSTEAIQICSITNINAYVYSIINETKCDDPVVHRPISSVIYHYSDGSEENVSCANSWSYQYVEQEYVNPYMGKTVTNIAIYLHLDLRGNDPGSDVAYLRNNRVYSTLTTKQGIIDIAIPTNHMTLKSFILYATCPNREQGDYLGYEISDGINTQHNLQVGVKYTADSFELPPDTLSIILEQAPSNATPQTPSISDMSFIYWTGN